jgi:hypothetical protein
VRRLFRIFGCHNIARTFVIFNKFRLEVTPEYRQPSILVHLLKSPFKSIS